MKKLIGLVLCFLIGSIGAALAMPMFAYGKRWGTTQLDMYSIFAFGTDHVFSVSANQQYTTGLEFPLFDSTYPFEPGSNGHAFEFVVNGEGGGGPPWVREVNTIFVIENGVGGPEFDVDVFGNVGIIPFNVFGTGYLLEDWKNMTPVDGDFGYMYPDTQGSIQISAVVFSYVVDGTPTNPGDFFTLTVSDGTNSWSIDFLCSDPFVLTQAQLLTPTIFVTHTPTVITASWSGTGTCITPPTFRSLQFYFHYVSASPF
jgi:hypothetical protein